MKYIKPRKNLKIPNFIILAVSICVSLLIMEIFLRIYDWYNKITNRNIEWVPTYEYSQTRHHRLIPNAISRHKEIEFDYIWANNSLGMRDIKRSKEKSPDVFRILFLGDSMIQGWGVSQKQSMTAILESNLNNPGRTKKIEVLNAGVFGYSPFLEYQYLKELLPVLKPDLVIEGFFLGNDIGDDYFYSSQAKLKLPDSSYFFENNDRWPWSEIDKLAVNRIKENQIKALSNHAVAFQYFYKLWNSVKAFLSKSRLFRFFNQIFTQNSERKELLELNRTIEQIKNENIDKIQINLGLVNFPVLNKELRLKYWRITEKYLAGIFYLCKVRNIPVVLVVIPSGERNGFNEPYEIINNFASGYSVSIINLKDGFLSHPGQTDYPIDGHWNPEGNRLAASIINKGLCSFNIIPVQVEKKIKIYSYTISNFK